MKLKDRCLVEDPVRECVDKAADVFTFSIEIPDPYAAAKVRISEAKLSLLWIENYFYVLLYSG